MSRHSIVDGILLSHDLLVLGTTILEPNFDLKVTKNKKDKSVTNIIVQINISVITSSLIPQ